MKNTGHQKNHRKKCVSQLIHIIVDDSPLNNCWWDRWCEELMNSRIKTINELSPKGERSYKLVVIAHAICGKGHTRKMTHEHIQCLTLYFFMQKQQRHI